MTILFLKYPAPGEVKTRLAARLGPDRACEIYRLFVERLCETCRDLSPTLCYDPRHSLAAYTAWLGPGVWWPQMGGDLGQRMRAALEQALREADQAVLIGTDSPQLDAQLLREAHRRLGNADLVLGPSLDGGYYLVGARGAVPPTMFEDVEWSTERVLQQTLRQLPGLRVELLSPQADVDTYDDLMAVLPSLGPGLRSAIEAVLSQ